MTMSSDILPTTAQITQALQAEGLLQGGAVVDAEVGERFQGFATAIFRCHLRYRSLGAESPPETMICKIYGPEWYESNGLRDQFFFRQIAPVFKAPIAPALYGLIHDPAARIIVLLIEDLAPGYQPMASPISDAWLEAIVDTLADVHAQWWDAPLLTTKELLEPEETEMRMAQALPLQGLRANMEAARDAISRFRSQLGAAITAEESDTLALLAERWAAHFTERLAGHRSLTLLHGDFHLLGNVFIAKAPDSPTPIKAIDWGQVKRGLGPHDLMYALLSVEAPDRRSRDLKLLQRYHQRLLLRGVPAYPWHQCVWDYRFSLLTNLFQSVFQGSLRWFRRTHDVVAIWEATSLLDAPSGTS